MGFLSGHVEGTEVDNILPRLISDSLVGEGDDSESNENYSQQFRVHGGGLLYSEPQRVSR